MGAALELFINVPPFNAFRKSKLQFKLETRAFFALFIAREYGLCSIVQHVLLWPESGKLAESLMQL
jgi:hypothetical protein